MSLECVFIYGQTANLQDCDHNHICLSHFDLTYYKLLMSSNLIVLALGFPICKFSYLSGHHQTPICHSSTHDILCQHLQRQWLLALLFYHALGMFWLISFPYWKGRVMYQNKKPLECSWLRFGLGDNLPLSHRALGSKEWTYCCNLLWQLQDKDSLWTRTWFCPLRTLKDKWQSFLSLLRFDDVRGFRHFRISPFLQMQRWDWVCLRKFFSPKLVKPLDMHREYRCILSTLSLPGALCIPQGRCP